MFVIQTFGVFSANEGLARFAMSHIFMAVNASAMLSVAFMFSCFNMKPAAATILALSYLFVNVVMGLLPYFNDYENWFITHHFNCSMLVFHNQIPWWQIVQSQVILLAISATVFIIGLMAFQVRDIKS
jgi:ABC-2 type transport system permease protein